MIDHLVFHTHTQSMYMMMALIYQKYLNFHFYNLSLIIFPLIVSSWKWTEESTFKGHIQILFHFTIVLTQCLRNLLFF